MVLYKTTGLTLFFAFLLCASVFSTSASAQGNLDLNTKDYTKAGLLTYIKSEQLLTTSAPVLEAVDLNNDLTKEWIAFDPACVAQKKLCPHVLIGGSIGSFVTLGEFDALKISAASQYTHGVRDILVYNNLTNEFKYNAVKWNSAMSSYTPTREVAYP